MKREILAELRNVLVKLYPDEASMRRISHDGGLDLARVSLNSNAINNWHSILIEAEKLDRVEVLLAAIRQEYGSNQEFVDVCKNIRQIDFIVPLGHWKEVRNSLFKEQSHTNAAQAIEERFQSFDWSKAEQAYLNKVIKLYDRVRILGSSSDVPLGNLFTQVYILDKPTAYYRHDIEELRKRSADRNEFQRQIGERVHGLELVKTGQNLFILGKPGAGKTTFLKYITIQAARKQLSRIPIFVSLNQWSDSRWGKGDKAALLPFLIEQFDICDFPNAALFIEYLLLEGRALVLFDGLDEVKEEEEQRRQLINLLKDFASKYDKSQYLITCRIAANEYAFAGFANVEVADFTWEQIREYARCWFGVDEKKLDAFTTELERPGNKGLAELCNTPLLLSFLCLLFDNNLRFPPSRAELYEDALETLLRKWDSSRQIQRDEIYRNLSYKRKLQLLMSIAVPTFEKGEIFFRQRDLERWIVDYLAKLPGALPTDALDSTAILKAIEAQHSLLVERARGIYSFSHLTFQEYLTARFFAENQSNELADKLIRNHLTDWRWREFFLLTASLLVEADGFIRILRQAIDEIITNIPKLIQILVWAQERTKQLSVPVSQRTVVQLAYLSRVLTLAYFHSVDFNRTRSQSRDSLIESSLDFARARPRLLALALDFANASNFANALDFALDFAIHFDLLRILSLARNPAINFSRVISRKQERAYKRDFDLPRALRLSLLRTRDFASATTPLVGFDYGLYYAWAYATLFADERVHTDSAWQNAMQDFPMLVQGVAKLADEGHRRDLAQHLLSVAIPSPAATAEEWQQYATALLAILRNQRDLGQEWNFTIEEINKLNDYFYANELLVQCLKVAAVSDRQAVLNGLLLPPEAG